MHPAQSDSCAIHCLFLLFSMVQVYLWLLHLACCSIFIFIYIYIDIYIYIYLYIYLILTNNIRHIRDFFVQNPAMASETPHSLDKTGDYRTPACCHMQCIGSQVFQGRSAAQPPIGSILETLSHTAPQDGLPAITHRIATPATSGAVGILWRPPQAGITLQVAMPGMAAPSSVGDRKQGRHRWQH